MAPSTARINPRRRETDASPAVPTSAARLLAIDAAAALPGEPLGVTSEMTLVAERAEEFARELGAVGAVGSVLAHRAALLSVRMEDLGRAGIVAVQVAERRALAAFDADRADAIAALLAEAETPGADPSAAIAALEGCPDGLAGLLRTWRGLLGRLAAGEAAAVEIVARWVRSAPEAVDLGARAEAEVDRLRQLARTIGAAERALAAARAEVGRAARLDPGPAATLARRHEAAAERGMKEAIRLIGQLNRQAGRAASAVSPVMPAAPAVPTPPARAGDRAASLGSFRSPASDPVGSFRPSPADPLASFRVGLDPASPEARRRRPDPTRLAASRR